MGSARSSRIGSRGTAFGFRGMAFGFRGMALGFLAMAFGFPGPAVGVRAASADAWALPFGPRALAAQEPVRDTADTASARWTVRDILMEESAGGFEFSPDGEWLVWSRSKMDAERGRSVSKLWLTRVSDGESWQLTRGDDSDRSPTWSPDGRRIAFVSSRDLPGGGDGDDEGGGGASQIWMLRLQGGEPWPVTKDARGLRGFEWKGSSDTLVILATEARARFERERRRADDDAIAVEDTLDAVPVRLWTVAADGGDVERLTDNDDRIQSMAVSPDGTTAVVRTEVSLSFGFDARVPPRTWLVDLGTGRRSEILTAERERRIIPSSVEWDDRGRGFYFTYSYSTHPIYRSASVTRMGYYDVADGRFVPVELGWERGVSGFDVVPGGFVAFLTDGVVDRPARYERAGDGWRRRMIEGEHVPNVWGAGVSDDGTRIAYRHSTASTPDQPYLARLDGARIADPTRIVTLNPSYASKPKPRTEIVHWIGARGDEVEGILYYPLDWEEGRPYPLVLNIHGGPAGRDSDAWDQSWASPIVLWNQKGAFVLQVNYHGSCCYGLEWVESIGGGNYYSLEVPDIESGVDWLVDRGMVHPDSVATQGWSNGAILSTALTVENPERYKASLAGAGDVEWISDFGNVDFGAAFDTYYFGTTPWEDPQRYIELSPFFRLDEVRTPTLLFFGTEDRNVPPSQGWSHFRALQQMGNTEVRFVLFPGEPHGLRELAHQRRKVEEEIRWLERHLWGLPDSARLARTLALADGSPLAAALARADAERSDDGMYGVRVGGVLVPETVPVGELKVGRFEVTRAQWREFRPEYDVEGATWHHPVNGIGFEDARAYVAWLSEQTGRAYRLPTEAELRRLTRGKTGITLDHWAGYDPNLDDRDRLGELVERLPGSGALLLEVGSHPGDATGEPPHIFDLGGNVAEWAVADDGSGVPVGGSADRPAGAAAEEAAPAYRGLRVVVGG